jgi:hypothetical protein
MSVLSQGFFLIRSAFGHVAPASALHYSFASSTL